jgi:DNA-binding CsgD family transcriptional regulator
MKAAPAGHKRDVERLHRREGQWETEEEIRYAPGGNVALIHGLTGGEARALELVALGMSSSQIAASQVVSKQAVTFHVGNLLMKLGAENRAGLVARAYVMRVLDPDVWPPRVDPTLIRDRRRGSDQLARSSVLRDVGGDSA